MYALNIIKADKAKSSIENELLKDLCASRIKQSPESLSKSNIK